MPRSFARCATLGAVASLALLLALPASAQLIARRDLSYSMALSIATGALDACKARGYPVAVVVVDRGGDTMGALRADDAAPHTMENARHSAPLAGAGQAPQQGVGCQEASRRRELRAYDVEG